MRLIELFISNFCVIFENLMRDETKGYIMNKCVT